MEMGRRGQLVIGCTCFHGDGRVHVTLPGDVHWFRTPSAAYSWHSLFGSGHLSIPFALFFRLRYLDILKTGRGNSRAFCEPQATALARNFGEQ